MVTDGRLPPFCWQSLAAHAAIRSRFEGEERATAIAIYTTLTYVANEQRRREGIEASRTDIATLAGRSVRTVDRYAEIFEDLGIVRVARRRDGGLNLPNLWTLIEPGGGEMAAPSPSDRLGGEVISLAKSARPTTQEGTTTTTTPTSLVNAAREASRSGGSGEEHDVEGLVAGLADSLRASGRRAGGTAP
jgi:hypothetical protein